MKLWMSHSWGCSRPDWMGLYANWSSEGIAIHGSAYFVCSPILPAAAVHPSMPAGSVQRGTALWLSRAVPISAGRSARTLVPASQHPPGAALMDVFGLPHPWEAAVPSCVMHMKPEQPARDAKQGSSVTPKVTGTPEPLTSEPLHIPCFCIPERCTQCSASSKVKD